MPVSPPRTSNKSENGTESKLDKSSVLNAGKVDLSLSKVLKNIKGRIPTQTQKDIKKDDKADSRLGVTQEMGEMDDMISPTVQNKVKKPDKEIPRLKTDKKSTDVIMALGRLFDYDKNIKNLIIDRTSYLRDKYKNFDTMLECNEYGKRAINPLIYLSAKRHGCLPGINEIDDYESKKSSVFNMCNRCFDAARENDLEATDYRSSCLTRAKNLAILVLEILDNKDCLSNIYHINA